MFIPPKQRKHLSQTSTCLSLLKCLVYIMSCICTRGYYSTVLNPTPDLTHFQTLVTAMDVINVSLIFIVPSNLFQILQFHQKLPKLDCSPEQFHVDDPMGSSAS